VAFNWLCRIELLVASSYQYLATSGRMVGADATRNQRLISIRAQSPASTHFKNVGPQSGSCEACTKRQRRPALATVTLSNVNTGLWFPLLLTIASTGSPRPDVKYLLIVASTMLLAIAESYCTGKGKVLYGG
jgi:hypothetical protein